jgi:hypothetical protein
LDLHVDGDANVGHRTPFGVFVSVRHSEAIGRESGGFGKYLQNQQNSGYYYSPYGKPPVNYRDDFEKQVREKFAESFEIISITFHDEKVQARGYGRANWRETPYAYLLMKAKDGSVDRIPPLQLDLDFLDKRGQVVLPVASQVQLIDARSAEAASRPVKNIEVSQILDDRDLAKGNLTLEIKATGRGLLPDLKEMLDLAIPGFKVSKVDDRGLSIAKLDAEGEDVTPISERNWLVALGVDPSSGKSATFRFPKANTTGVGFNYKRYADADLVEVKPELALTGLSLHPRTVWTWISLGAALAVLAVVSLWWWRKERLASPVERAPVYVVPGHITPFTVISLLRRIHSDGKLALDDGQRKELESAISGLQEYFFDRPAQTRNGQPDLEQIAKRWVGSAN